MKKIKEFSVAFAICTVVLSSLFLEQWLSGETSAFWQQCKYILATSFICTIILLALIKIIFPNYD